MKFSVVVCPKCRSAKVVESGVKTTTCFICGRRLIVGKLKKFYEGDNLSEAQVVVGLLNAKRDGREEEFISY